MKKVFSKIEISILESSESCMVTFFYTKSASELRNIFILFQEMFNRDGINWVHVRDYYFEKYPKLKDLYINKSDYNQKEF